MDVTAAQIVVVVAKNSEINQLDNTSVANIFLAKTKQFPNGEKALPIELKNNTLRSKFYFGISGKTQSQLNAYWTTLVFTGKGKPPQSLSDEDKLLLKLMQKPGAISYMLENQVTEDLKIVYQFP